MVRRCIIYGWWNNIDDKYTDSLYCIIYTYYKWRRFLLIFGVVYVRGFYIDESLMVFSYKGYIYEKNIVNIDKSFFWKIWCYIDNIRNWCRMVWVGEDVYDEKEYWCLCISYVYKNRRNYICIFVCCYGDFCSMYGILMIFL